MSLSAAPVRPRPLVRPAPEGRPPAERWLSELVPVLPDQPALDFGPADEPALVSLDVVPHGMPDTARWSAALGLSVLEVFSGRRPVTQVGRWLSDDALASLTQALPVARRRPGPRTPPPPAAVQSVRVQHPTPAAAEVTVHGRLGGRSVAMALRLTVYRGRWLCTSLALPPAHLLAAALEPGGGPAAKAASAA